ncbi:unnamed protein product, partial [Hapterophycus canaliculatus]
VRLPKGGDLRYVKIIHRYLGFPRAAGSADCTRVACERCSPSETSNLEGKEGHRSVVYEAICDHAGRILASERRLPGAENDKTVVKHDHAATNIRNEDAQNSCKFNVVDADGETSAQTWKWLICDGGYHQ